MSSSSLVALVASLGASVSVRAIETVSTAYLDHLRQFSSDPDWGGYGYYQGEPPSALEVELERPVAELLDDYDPEVDLEAYLEELVANGDSRVNAVYGREAPVSRGEVVP